MINLSIFCQIIPTKKQQLIIDKLTTPERLIEYSKGLSNEKNLTKKYDSLVKLINLRNKEIKFLILDHKNTLIKIATANIQVNQIDKNIEELEEKIKPGFFKSNFHLYGSLYSPQLNFNKTILSGELLLDLKILELGVVLNSFPEENRLDFNYGLKIRYKFF